MLRGFFESGRPKLRGILRLPRLGISREIDWLVDTGSDSGLLNVSDAVAMRLDFSLLRDRAPSWGIGGYVETFAELAMLMFDEPGIGRHIFIRNLAISDNHGNLLNLPSLLGRDVLNNWKMSYNPSAGELTFEVVRSEGGIFTAGR